jgi:hypothetical protein
MRSDKTAMMIELITSWIITVFSIFAPKWEPAKMGAALPGFQTELFSSFPLQNFLQPLKIYFFFILYPLSFLLSTASSHRVPKPHRLFPHFAPPASPNRTAYFPISHRLRPHSAPRN